MIKWGGGDMDVNVEIGKRLKEYRKKRGVTTTHIAKMLGIHSQRISMMEGGKVKFRVDKLLETCKVYRLSLSWLISEIEFRKEDEE